MRREHFLDLARPDLIAAGLDQILLPIDDEQVAVVVEIAEVAGVQPAPACRVPIDRGIVVVAQHAAPFRPAGSRTRPSAAAPRSRSRRPRSAAARACRSSASKMRTCTSGSGMPTDPSLFGPLHRVDAQRHHRFGQRIAFDDAAAGQRLEALLGVGQQRRGAGEADLDRLEVDLAALHVGMIQQRDVERRHAVEERRLDAADRGEQIGQVARIRHERERIRR